MGPKSWILVLSFLLILRCFFKELIRGFIMVVTNTLLSQRYFHIRFKSPKHIMHI